MKNPNLIAWGIELDDLLIVEQTNQYLVNDLLVLEKDGNINSINSLMKFRMGKVLLKKFYFH